MLTEPGDLDHSELHALLERHWGLRDLTLDYLPIGFGSHHWNAVDPRGVRRFVTVDDLTAGFQAGPNADWAFAALERAFRTAAVLRDEAELDFVVAPSPDREGIVTRRLDHRYSVTVSPFIDGQSSTWGPYESPDDRRRMAGVLGRLHAATEHVPEGLPRTEDFSVPSRAALTEALLDLDRPWTSGPFGEPARQLLRSSRHDIAERLREYDELVARVRERSEAWVVTHGEPHRANVICDPQGGIHLVDWDTTLIAPRERDLHMVLDEDLTGLDEYIANAGSTLLDQEAMELYRRWWELSDITVPVQLVRRPHQRTEDTAASFDNLTGNLESLPNPGAARSTDS